MFIYVWLFDFFITLLLLLSINHILFLELLLD